MAEAREAVTADNELGEMGSFLNGSGGGGSGGGGGAGAKAGWDHELEGGGLSKRGAGPTAAETDDDDEVCRALRSRSVASGESMSRLGWRRAEVCLSARCLAGCVLGRPARCACCFCPAK